MQRNLATERIWQEFHERLLSFIRRRVSNESDCEDILQDVFTRIHAHQERLVDVQSITGWIYRITRNAIIDYHRAQARAAGAVERHADEKPAPLPDERELASAQATRELAHCIEPLLTRLPEHYGRAVALTELEEISQVEAARQIGLSVSGMKSRVQRGRAKLAEVLLDCCDVELDGRSGVVGYQPRDGAPPCSCSPPGRRPV